MHHSTLGIREVLSSLVPSTKADPRIIYRRLFSNSGRLSSSRFSICGLAYVHRCSCYTHTRGGFPSFQNAPWSLTTTRWGERLKLKVLPVTRGPFFRRVPEASVIARLGLLVTETVFLASKGGWDLAGGPETVSVCCAQHSIVSPAQLAGKSGCSLPPSGKRPWVSANVLEG